MLKNLPSLNNVKTFAIAAHLMSFKEAAKVLNVTPTAVSHQIKALESHLRVPLFERHTRAIKLTAQGQALAKTCFDTLNTLDNAFVEFSPHQKDLLISCCNSFAALWLAPKMGIITSLFPHQKVVICASDKLINLNEDKHIDIALRYGHSQSNAEETCLVTEQIGGYCSLNYQPPVGRKPVLFVTHWRDDEGLKNIPWKNYVDENLYEVQYFEQEHFVLQAALAGQGVALVSNVLARSAVECGWLKQYENISSFVGYSYWSRKTAHRRNSSELHQFSNWLEKELGRTC
ncbi:LysR family transcriptional regulator [Pseudoalteromonas sp. SCSIO 43201]|uniref:LysR family transcriptional regulator n=1 Tax=Pseudoalteromonas sp. SCSIO 43201 TaxID=2822842 RepID=UPI0021847CB4|nr:LysR family transcriptional regulator [Pseudoalteromonas sp. SCSIO 43201]USD29900.1 LysR family transcriptional regulator [Pseudoalteromonas sp. SCSIO 43201]